MANGVTTQIDGPVLRVTLDRPEKLNAVNTPMLWALKEAIEAADDDAVRVVVLTGAGRGFCAGGDLTGVDTDGAVIAANAAVQAITELSKPVVAGVRGPAAGYGCPLALSCDLVVAARSAFFQLAFVRIGLMPDGGASALLPAAIGRARTARMALLAEKVEATTAFDWGMITHVVDDEAFEAELESVVQRLAAGPQASYGWIKRALRTTTLAGLSPAHALEAEGQQELVNSPDHKRLAHEFRQRARR